MRFSHVIFFHSWFQFFFRIFLTQYFCSSMFHKDPWHSLVRLCVECRGTAWNSAALREHDTEGPSSIPFRPYFTPTAHNGQANGVWRRSDWPREWKRPNGHTLNTWLSKIKDDLAPINTGLFSAVQNAQTRPDMVEGRCNCSTKKLTV